MRSVAPRPAIRTRVAPRPRKRLALAIVFASAAAAAIGQDASPAASAPAPQATQATRELPAAVLATLEQIRDYAFDFDQAGFYAVAEYLKRTRSIPGADEPPAVIDDWRVFAEQPNDLRGHPVTLTGIVGHNRSWSLRSRPQLGNLWQIELFDKRQPIACTVIFTQIAEDVPINATITVTGYFVMMRSYYDKNNQPRHAALLVAPGPTSISRSTSAGSGDSFLSQPSALVWTIGAVGAGLVIALVLLRRATARPATAFEALRARGAATSDAEFERWPGGAADSSAPSTTETPLSEPPRAADSKS